MNPTIPVYNSEQFELMVDFINSNGYKNNLARLLKVLVREHCLGTRDGDKI